MAKKCSWVKRCWPRLSVSVAAIALSGGVVLDPRSKADAEACNLGQSCGFDVTTQVDVPGVGTTTLVTPVTADLTNLNADGSGEVKVSTPGATVTSDTGKKDFRVSKGKGKSKQTFKPDKSKKNSGVTITKSKDRKGG